MSDLLQEAIDGAKVGESQETFVGRLVSLAKERRSGVSLALPPNYSTTGKAAQRLAEGHSITVPIEIEPCDLSASLATAGEAHKAALEAEVRRRIYLAAALRAILLAAAPAVMGGTVTAATVADVVRRLVDGLRALNEAARAADAASQTSDPEHAPANPHSEAT